MVYKKTRSKNFAENIIILVGRSLWSLLILPFKRNGKTELAVRWGEIQELMQKDDPSAWTLAIIKADSILDAALKKRVSGETMGERLKAMRGKMNSDALQSAWDGHKIRNKIVHEGVKISKKEAQSAIVNIRKALNSLREL